MANTKKNTNIHCPMIHNGLSLSVASDPKLISSCCLRPHEKINYEVSNSLWDDPFFIPLIEKNKKNEWDPGCANCKSLEEVGHVSFRQGMLTAWGQEERLSGPRRINFNFSSSCNIACRICGPTASTYWAKHQKENKIDFPAVQKNKTGQEAIEMLKKFDLSNLRSLTFNGGETLLGNDYWEVCEYLATLPHAKESLMISFQTNGTQPIPKKRYDLLDKFHLIKLHVSLDGVEERFNYQRWPADWKQVEENLFNIKENAPGNVMFLIEETLSIFNLAYLGEVAKWRKQYFNTNREGDLVDHTHHIAQGAYHHRGCTQEYVDFLRTTKESNIISADWEEDPVLIKKMIAEIKQYDHFRNQSFKESLPKVAEFYKRYL